MTNEFYTYVLEHKMDIKLHPNAPIKFNDPELARDFFGNFQEEHPESIFYDFGEFGQYICLNDAEKNYMFDLIMAKME